MQMSTPPNPLIPSYETNPTQKRWKVAGKPISCNSHFKDVTSLHYTGNMSMFYGILSNSCQANQAIQTLDKYKSVWIKPSLT